MKQSENRESNMEDRIVVSDNKNKHLLTIARDHKNTIQQLQNKAKKKNIRLIGVNENSGVSTNNIKNLFRE